MNRSLIQIYALCVCFVTLMCFVVSLGIGLYDGVQIAAPEFTVQLPDELRSNARFLEYHPDEKNLPQQEIDSLRQAGYRDALAAERRVAMQSVVFIAIILLIDIVVFAVHWRIAKTPERGVAPAVVPQEVGQ